MTAFPTKASFVQAHAGDLSRHLLTVSIRQQVMWLWKREQPGEVGWFTLRGVTGQANTRYRLMRKYRCSTSKFGIGQAAGSNCTPLGLHRVAKKVGGGWPVGTVFKSRQPVGCTWKGMPLAAITTRILWLEGLEPGFNQGGDVDTFQRYIYIHGTGDESTLGRPASHGCVHLAAKDLMPLYDLLPVGTLVWIER